MSEKYTLDEVMTAAKHARVGSRTAALRAELEALAASRYLMRDNGDSGCAVHEQACQEWVRGLYETMHDWREVGAVIGMPAAYAWRLAHATVRPNRAVIARFDQEQEARE